MANWNTVLCIELEGIVYTVRHWLREACGYSAALIASSAYHYLMQSFLDFVAVILHGIKFKSCTVSV